MLVSENLLSHLYIVQVKKKEESEEEEESDEESEEEEEKKEEIKPKPAARVNQYNTNETFHVKRQNPNQQRG